MSDPTLEDEQLISQDDIDQLLDSSSMEDAEDILSADEDDLGELSQDDIDSLLNSNTEEPDEELPDLDDDDDMELISQDDIDSLMNASVDDDAPADDGAGDDADDDDFGELSQDDIDSLMTAPSEDESGVDDASADPDEEALGELSQDDIDSLMNASADDETPEVSDTDDDDFGELSQDDIDGLMNASGSDEDDATADDAEDEMEMISQDDIKNLMNPDADADEEGGSDDPVSETVSDAGEDEVAPAESPQPSFREDVPADAEAGQVEPPLEEPVEAPAQVSQGEDDDWVITDDQSVPAEECVVTQETLDGLIDGFDPTPDPEPVVLDEEPKEEAEEAVDPPSGSEEPSETGLDDPGEDTTDVVNLDEESVDDLISAEEPAAESGDDDVAMLDFDEDDEDVTQEDIDALLMETDDDEEEEEDILISQDDIDTLLMAADDEDEDVLGDLMDSESEVDLDGDFDDEDILDSDTEEEDDDEEEEDDDSGQDQVILEGGEDEPVKKKPKKKRNPLLAKGWYKSKLVIAGASALLVLGIAVPIAYFLFFKGEAPAPQGADLVVQQAVSQAPGGMPDASVAAPATVETVEITVEQPLPKISGNMVLSDFVILAPVESREISYLSADISIDYSDQRAYHEIQNNLSFYRDLIYDSIKKRLLVTKEQQEVTEADILLVIEATLNKVLPGNYIDRVSFKSFKIS
jgi:hypothetical protein